MSDFSSFTGRFRAQRTGSYKSSSAKVTKRPRDSLVCNQCRKSKLRCDRGQPCSACITRNDGADCSYHRSAEPRVDVNRHAVVEDRLVHLESMIKTLMQSQTSGLLGNEAISTQSLDQPEIPHVPVSALDQQDQPRTPQLLDTRYVGQTHWSTILDDIQELKVALGSSADANEAQEPFGLETLNSGRDPIFGASNDYNIQQIISQYLPLRVETDRFLSIYFRGENFILPFVHSIDFQHQYREFWADPANVNPLWLSILFSICYLSSLIGEAIVSAPSSETELVTGLSTLHVAAGQCLVLGEYQRPQRFTVEALIMYAHCKNLRTSDPSREAGTILSMAVRLAYELGYHRDPDSFGSFTTFEGEMQRRAWAVCKQMDLMISFMLGLPSNIRLEDCDTKSPRNLLDSDFDAETQDLPASRPENEATRLLWFIVKDSQMDSFSKVCQNALSFREATEPEILELDKAVRQMQAAIPEVLRARPLSESITDSPFLIMTRFYVQFISLKSFCVLHRKYMARGNVLSTASCVEAGTKLVSSFLDMYKEFSLGGQLSSERWMLGNFTMNDFLLGVMVLCLVMHTRWKRGSLNSAIDTATENEVLTLLEQSYVVCLEKSLTSRDARRVAHAIRLTLNGAKTSNPPKDTSSLSFLRPPADSSSMQSATVEANGVVSTSRLLHPSYAHGQSHEAAFGLLDPFNFMGNDIENINWAAFDQQILNQDSVYTESFMSM